MFNSQPRFGILAAVLALAPSLGVPPNSPESEQQDRRDTSLRRLEKLADRLGSLEQDRSAMSSSLESLSLNLRKQREIQSADILALQNDIRELAWKEAEISNQTLDLAVRSDALNKTQLSSHQFLSDQLFRSELYAARTNFCSTIGAYIPPDLVDHLFVVNLAVTMVESLEGSNLDPENKAALEKQKIELVAHFKSSDFNKKQSQDFLKIVLARGESQIGPTDRSIGNPAILPRLNEPTPLQEDFDTFTRNASDAAVKAAKMIGEAGKWGVDTWVDYRREKIIEDFLSHTRVSRLTALVGPIGAAVDFCSKTTPTACSGLFEKLDVKLDECVSEASSKYNEWRDNHGSLSESDAHALFKDSVANGALRSNDKSTGTDLFDSWDWGSSSIFDECPTWNDCWFESSESGESGIGDSEADEGDMTFNDIP